MIKARGLLLAIGAGVVMVIVATSWSRMREARAHSAREREDLLGTLREVAEIHELRSRRQHADVGEPPSEDLLARVQSVLSEAGVPNRRFEALTKRSDRPASAGPGRTGTPYKVRADVLRLRELPPAELGSFLDAWSRAQPLWTVSRIELVNVPGSLGLFDADIELTTLYIDFHISGEERAP